MNKININISNSTLDSYLSKSYKFRGEIIELTIFLERCIDDVLAMYFCDDAHKKNDIIKMLLSSKRITFDNKYEVFKAIRNKGKGIKSHISNEDISHIKDVVIPVRNILAHQITDTRLSNLNKYINNNELGLYKADNTNSTKIYRFEDLIIMIDKLKSLNKKFNNLLKTIYDSRQATRLPSNS